MSFNISYQKPSYLPPDPCAKCGGSGICPDGHMVKSWKDGTPCDVCVTYNFTAAISKAIDCKIGGDLQHYRDFLKGKTGKETIDILKKARKTLKDDRRTDEANFIDQLISWTEYCPDAVWNWSH